MPRCKGLFVPAADAVPLLCEFSIIGKVYKIIIV